MFCDFNFKTFNFNVEVGLQATISKSVTLRTLLDLFRNRHLRSLELVFGRFIQQTNRNLKKREFKMR
jgi:hypothetical protein